VEAIEVTLAKRGKALDLTAKHAKSAVRDGRRGLRRMKHDAQSNARPGREETRTRA